MTDDPATPDRTPAASDRQAAAPVDPDVAPLPDPAAVLADAVRAIAPAGPEPDTYPHDAPFRIDGDLHQLLDAALGAVPGLALVSLDVLLNDDHHNAVSITIEVDGWSPSLHALGMRWEVSLDPQALADLAELAESLPVRLLPARLVAPFLLAAMEDRLAVQRRRAADSAELGHPVPRRVEKADDVAHLAVDRAVVAGLAAQHLAAKVGDSDRAHTADEALRLAVSDLRENVRLAHQHAVDNDGGPVLVHTADTPSADRPFICGIADENGSSHLDVVVEGPPKADDPHGRPAFQIRDGVLTMEAAMPHALAAACAGRTVAEIATLPEPFDGILGPRRIRSASATRLGTRPVVIVHLVPDRIRIADALNAVTAIRSAGRPRRKR